MISVIVPVYNSEKYLHRCIDSILAQTYTDFELLLIDDGSTDSSGAICDEYARKDSRVRVFHKKNGGVSSARNLGLDNAQGEWITFVDTDDKLYSPRVLFELLKYAKVDLVVSASCFNYTNRKVKVQLEDKGLIKGYQEISGFLTRNLNSAILRVPWGKLYRKELINQKKVRFNERLTIGEDAIFNIDYFSLVSSIQIIPNITILYSAIDDDVFLRKYQGNKSIFDSYKSYKESISILGQKYIISGARIFYGIMYDLAKKDIELSPKNINAFSAFLLDEDVVLTLKERKSLHIAVQLWLNAYTNPQILYLYILVCKFMKSSMRKILKRE